MDWAANHVDFVLAAYGITALVLAAVVLRTVWKAQALKARLKDMNLPDAGQKD
jgi:heme exporter protein CcmD